MGSRSGGGRESRSIPEFPRGNGGPVSTQKCNDSEQKNKTTVQEQIPRSHRESVWPPSPSGSRGVCYENPNAGNLETPSGLGRRTTGVSCRTSHKLVYRFERLEKSQNPALLSQYQSSYSYTSLLMRVSWDSAQLHTYDSHSSMAE